MVEPAGRHLEEGDFDRLLISRDATGNAASQDDAQRHLDSCVTCQRRMRVYEETLKQLPLLASDRDSSRGESCPDSAIWARVVLGTVAIPEAEEALAHAAQCSHCGPRLREAAVIQTAPSEEELKIIPALKSAQPAWQRALAQKLSALGEGPLANGTRLHTPWKWWPASVPVRRWALAAALVALGSATWLAVLHTRETSAENLLAKAYTERRTLELRIPGAGHAPMRLERGPDRSRLSQPQTLLDAESVIARKLTEHPGDAGWLNLKGRADLLDGNYNAAIESLRQALDNAPDSVPVMIDLASAHFAKAEAENHASDYAIAVDLLGKVSARTPDDPVLLFNRAIASERLSLYVQAKADWEHYLKVDPNGPWSEEARTRLRDLDEKFRKRGSTADQPLLTPEQFNHDVVLAEPATWEPVDRRIEEYLATATGDWLPQAFSSERGAATSDFRGALEKLAVVARERHQDLWLSQMLSHPPNHRYAEALSTLARAIRASRKGNFVTAIEQAEIARTGFDAESSPAGAARALVEKMYALHLADQARACLAASAELSHDASLPSYRWIHVQALLEKGTCSNMEGDVGSAERSFATAEREADKSGYPTLSLRARGFLAHTLFDTGRIDDALEACVKGLQTYWGGSVGSMPGYNLYAVMDEIAQQRQQFDLNVTIDEQAVNLLSSSEDVFLRAEEHHRLAQAAVLAERPETAEENFRIVNRLLSSAGDNEIRENYRVGIEIDRARLESRRGKTDAALARLQSVGATIGQVSNRYLAAGYYQVLGELKADKGQLPEAETAFDAALDIAEQELASLRTEQERIGWTQQVRTAYSDMVELKLRQQDATAALDVLEQYRGAALRAGTKSGAHREDQAQFPREFSDLLNHLATDRSNRTVLVFALLPHGLGRWMLDDRGISGELVSAQAESVRTMSRRFEQLCGDPTSSLAVTRQVAAHLYRILLGPVTDRVLRSRVLEIDAGDEELGTIAFQALVDPAGEYLIDRNPIVYLPGLFSVPATSREIVSFAERRPLIVASSSPGQNPELRPLADAEAEAEEVAERLPGSRLIVGSEATLPRVKAELAQASLFHFAGHAVQRFGRVGLLLPGDDPTAPDLLDAAALLTNKFPMMQLAVLSACSTQAAQEGTIHNWESLTRGFLRAGVQHVIASRWSVDSDSSRRLMRSFYDGLVAGQDPAATLAFAEAQVRRQPETVHPYYWAAFSVFESI